MTRSRQKIFVALALVLLNVAILIVDLKEMNLRHVPLSSLSVADWSFDIFVIASTILAAFILPMVSAIMVIASYGALFVSDLVIFGPISYYQMLFGRYHNDHDIFFGGLVWLGQTILLVIAAAVLLIRKMFRRRLAREALPS